MINPITIVTDQWKVDCLLKYFVKFIKTSSINFHIFLCSQKYKSRGIYSKIILHYKTTTRDGYKEYISKVDDCKNCPYRPKCFSDKGNIKTVIIHVWESYK